MHYKCPKCNGKGHIRDGGMTLLATICTFGILPVMDYIVGGQVLTDECSLCNGYGTIED